MTNAHELNLPKRTSMKIPARLTKRFIAFLIDCWLLLFVVVMPFSSLFKSQMEQISSIQYAAAFVMMIFIWFYFIMFQYVFGQTCGMMIMHLGLVGNNTLFRLALHNCFILPVFPFYLLWVIEPIMIVFTKQRLLERFSKLRLIETVVI